MTARFADIVALNFQIDPKILEPFVPRGVELDFYEGETYVSLVALVLRRVRVWGIPIHVVGGFGEFNLRYYVRRKSGEQLSSGACFLKDYVSSSTAAWILGSAFKASFNRIKMVYENEGFGSKDPQVVPRVDYRWKVGDHWNRIRVVARKRIERKGPGTKVGFILEHSSKFSSRGGCTYEYKVQQPSWTIWDAAQATFTCDVKKLFGAEFEKPLSRRPVSVFVAGGSDVTIFSSNKIS
jgi:hypothetical protein